MKEEKEGGGKGGSRSLSYRLAEQPGKSEESFCHLLGHQNQKRRWVETGRWREPSCHNALWVCGFLLSYFIMG